MGLYHIFARLLNVRSFTAHVRVYVSWLHRSLDEVIPISTTHVCGCTMPLTRTRSTAEVALDPP